jgi:hypothetical protein
MRIPNHLFRSVTTRYVLAGLLCATVGFAQNPGWRRADEPGPNTSASADPSQSDPSTPVAQPPADYPPQPEPQAAPPAGQPGAFGQPGVTSQRYPTGAPYGVIPPSLTIPSGKFLTVRINQPLSSDHNQVGDFFSATLAEPVVVDGVVVAQQGQTVSGRVSLVEKGKGFGGVSKLGLELTQLSAVDGQQLPIHTQFVGRDARCTANGRDVATVATTTGVGAVVGGAVGWGTGAAIGAGAGAIAGLAAVALGHGAPAVLYPESLLSFQLTAPVSVSTERAPQAFRYVDPNDYGQQPGLQTRMNGAPPPPPYGAAYPYGYGSSYGYGYPYPYAYPYAYAPYWGPGFGVYIGPRFGYYGYGGFRGGFGYRGFHR